MFPSESSLSVEFWGKSLVASTRQRYDYRSWSMCASIILQRRNSPMETRQKRGDWNMEEMPKKNFFFFLLFDSPSWIIWMWKWRGMRLDICWEETGSVIGWRMLDVVKVYSTGCQTYGPRAINGPHGVSIRPTLFMFCKMKICLLHPTGLLLGDWKTICSSTEELHQFQFI